MNIFLIEKYIKKTKKEDIINYAKLQNINLTNEETDILYYYLKNYYKTFLTNPPSRTYILNELKQSLSPEIATKLDELYNQYKNKI